MPREEDCSHDGECTGRSYDDEVAQVGGFGSRWRSNVGNVTNDTPPSMISDAQCTSSSQAEAKEIEYRAPITSPNLTPPALSALFNPSLQLPARKRSSMVLCDTTDLGNDDNGLKRRHTEFDDVYPVGGGACDCTRDTHASR